MSIIQHILFCLLFIGMVKFGAWDGAINGIYFYSKPVQIRTVVIGLTDWATITAGICLFPWNCGWQNFSGVTGGNTKNGYSSPYVRRTFRSFSGDRFTSEISSNLKG